MNRQERIENRFRKWEEEYFSELDREPDEDDPNSLGLLEAARKECQERKRENAKYYEDLAIRRDLELKERRTAECWLCGLVKLVHIHHIDGNHKNNEECNLSVICESCHVWVHKQKPLPDNDQLRTMRDHIKSEHPERFAKIGKNPFNRPNTMNVTHPQLKFSL